MIKNLFNDMPMKRQLLISGWGMLVVSFLSIPYAIFNFIIIFQKHQLNGLLSVVISILSLLFGIFVFVTFKRYLNEKQNFFNANKIITIAIIFIILEEVGSNTLQLMHFSVIVNGIISLILLIPDGVVGLVLSLTLLQLKKNIFGIFKLYCYILLVGNILQLTLILSPIGLLFGFIANFILAIFLIKAGNQESKLKKKK